MKFLKELAEEAGISSSYVDKIGKTHYTSGEVQKFFLSVLGIPAETESQTLHQLNKLRENVVLPKVMAFFEDEKPVLSLGGNGVYDIKIVDEAENVVQSFTISCGEKKEIKNLSLGYYNIEAKQNENVLHSLLVYAPKYCYQPKFLQNKEHIFGTAVMLYAMRSKNNMGIGDFADLADIVRLTAENGGDVVGINPLGVMSPFMQTDENSCRYAEALEQDKSNVFRQCDVSPYRTLSRLFINYVYLNLYEEPDFVNSSEAKNFVNSTEVSQKIQELRNTDKVDYASVLLLKLNILNIMYRYFVENADENRLAQFEKYCLEKGEELDNLATFETLLETQKTESYWRYWVKGFDDINSAATKRFKTENKNRIRFYKYCHWLADLQVKKVQNLAESLGMKVGLYCDMPIGAASNGAEVWENKQAYVLEAGIGAPADPMRPRGQSWGFVPYHPQKLMEQYYKPFIRLVQENMKISGALRIDHAMGLLRLFWGFFTADNPVVQGAYVYYSMKIAVAILALESVRHNCLIIGEDLGTVPEGFREYMAEHGLLSYKVFCRQKEQDGSFIKPEKYLYSSLAQISTHDQATACGFWSNEDIEVFKKCGLYVNEEQYIANLNGRMKDRINMIAAFKEQNMLSEDAENELSATAEKGDKIPENIEKLLNIYGAKTNSALFLVRINDIYRQKELDNAPGTVHEYPNWRIKMNETVENMANSAEFKEFLQMIKVNRPQEKE